MDVRIKRAYEPSEDADGSRVLIDRIWPRGISHEQARLDDWARELAPSAALRIWFGHDPARFAEFRRRYLIELEEDHDDVRLLAPENPLPVGGGAGRTEGVFLMAPPEAFEDGRLAISFRISDGGRYRESFEYLLVGPRRGEHPERDGERRESGRRGEKP